MINHAEKKNKIHKLLHCEKERKRTDFSQRSQNFNSIFPMLEDLKTTLFLHL